MSLQVLPESVGIDAVKGAMRALPPRIVSPVRRAVLLYVGGGVIFVWHLSLRVPYFHIDGDAVNPRFRFEEVVFVLDEGGLNFAAFIAMQSGYALLRQLLGLEIIIGVAIKLEARICKPAVAAMRDFARVADEVIDDAWKRRLVRHAERVYPVGANAFYAGMTG
jgi:hypothetical protein